MSLDLNRVLRGRVWKFGDSIETVAINPYYQYPTMDELKQHTMEAYRPEFPREVKAGDIVVAGRNFGCGAGRSAGGDRYGQRHERDGDRPEESKQAGRAAAPAQPRESQQGAGSGG